MYTYIAHKLFLFASPIVLIVIMIQTDVRKTIHGIRLSNKATIIQLLLQRHKVHYKKRNAFDIDAESASGDE